MNYYDLRGPPTAAPGLLPLPTRSPPANPALAGPPRYSDEHIYTGRTVTRVRRLLPQTRRRTYLAGTSRGRDSGHDEDAAIDDRFRTAPGSIEDPMTAII